MTGGRRVRRSVAATVVTSAAAAALLGAGTGVANAGVNGALGYDPVSNKGSLYNVAKVIGAHELYAAGITGKGVGVALIDTGVAPVKGLTSGNVVNGPDLSFDSQDPATAYTDGFGHGTHLGSIVAGRDTEGVPLSYTDPNNWHGIAPDATLVNVKVGAVNGAVDVTQVIAGIDWVVQHKDELKIKVINLSYGTDSVQSSMIDPLAFAVENAWKQGIVVVAAGGNDGDTSKTLANPSSDPHVIAVGAMDSGGTVATTDDAVPSWSTHGTEARHVDVVAPGVSVLGLRVPGGTADSANPQARVGSRYAKASGTSQAAAVVSGEVALLLQANPTLKPDQIKMLLQDNASGLVRTSTKMGGAGKTDLKKMFEQVLKLAPIRPAPESTWGNGTGSLEAARGTAHVAIGDEALSGEVDVFGQAWSGSRWAKQADKKKAWKDGTWLGTKLTGKNWLKGSKDQQRTWPTETWTQTDEAVASDDDWSARMWRDGTWSARMWRDEAWSARMWRDESWSARMWRDEAWSSQSWG